MNAVSQQNAIDTKAVVIMYGWFGAASKNLKKYAELYINHPQNKCAVVYGTVDKPTIITRNDAKLAAMVMDSVRKAVEIIRNVESAATDGGKDIPVVLHYFSNGGAFIVEKLGLMINDAISGQMKGHHQDAEDLKAISKRLKTKGFEVLDSAPAYLYESTAYRVVDSSVPTLPLKLILKCLVYITIVITKTASYIRKRERADNIFWKNMLESDLCQRQAFIYSTIDVMTDSEKLDEFIEARKKQGIDVTVLKFDDSNHVLHMKKHPKEYKEKIVDFVLKSVCLQC